MSHFDLEQEKGLRYAFGHLVSSFMTDAHAGDSGDLADDVMAELGLTEREKEIMTVIAEHEYTRHTEWRDQGVLL